MRIINISGGDLFHIASIEFGDALQWINIAKMNKLTDPVLIGRTTIVIPPVSSIYADGIGPQ